MTCPLCGSANDARTRFCVTCGHALAPASPEGTRAGPSPALLRTIPDAPSTVPEPPPPPAAPAAIEPGRVVDLAPAEEPPMQRLCPRCRGASEAQSQFCRFCGASMGDARAFPVQPSPNPIAAVPPPPAPAPATAPVPAPPPPVVAVPPLPVAAARAAPAALPVPETSASASPARLVLVGRDGSEGQTFPLLETTDIGRAEGHILIADDRFISPRHARVTRRGGVFWLRDLESVNGVFVRVPFLRGDAPEASSLAPGEQFLADQDLFLVGQQVLRFEIVRHADEGFGAASENGTLLFGTPATPRYARLCQRTVEGITRDVFHLRKPETVLGREQGDIVFPDDPFLSRRHCALRVHPGAAAGAPARFVLSDLGSSNGTFLQARDEVRLRHGDHFRIGQQLLRFDS